MRRIQLFALLLVSMLLGYSASLHAEDIDVYTSNSSNIGTPNVLFVLDNGANFSADANGTGCTSYDGTTEVPSLGTTKESGILQCGLVNAINSLKDSAVKIGFVVSNANSFGETQATTDTTKGGYHDKCQAGGVGGCVLRNLMLMDTAGKSSMIAFIKGWNMSGTSDANGFNIKVNNSVQATTMQETWAYLAGSTGLSGKTYSPSYLNTGCQKNFVIYISNTEKDTSTNEYTNASSALTTAQSGTTTTTGDITGTVKFNQSVCGIAYSVAPASPTYTLVSGNNKADEWARFMYQNDGGAAGNFGVQNITTYTIGILGPTNKCSLDTLGMMSSMASHGGGKFYMTSDVSTLTSVLNTILNEVQAVNSVFSSASLPVSVNAQGTYLNQIYLGMFRPDSTASPRWLGNLKQYQLIFDTNGNLVLGDAQSPSQSAISASGTGFISPTAVSFWTTKNTATSPDSLGGFFRNNAEGTPISGYDSPDGEVVEKGGAAQQMRIENLTATFAGASNTTSTNPRRLYTYCPSGSNCQSALTDSSNDFATTNTGIVAATFGSSSTVKISSIVRSGTTATVTTSSAHGFATGTTVTITNASPSDYNGNKSITVTSSTTFTFTVGDYPNTTANNTYQVATIGGSPATITSITRTPDAASTADYESVTVTTNPAHGFTTANNLQVTGSVTPSNYLITGYPSAYTSTTLTFSNAVRITPPATATNSYTAAFNTSVATSLSNPSQGNVSGTFSTNINLRSGQSFIISGAGNTKYNGTYTVNSATYSNGTTTFTASMTSNGSNSLKSQSSTTATLFLDTTAKAIGTLKRTGTTDSATATADGLPPNWFGTASGDTATLTIAKSLGSATNESAYELASVKGTCQNSGCTTLTFPITVSPSSTVTLSSAKIGPPGSSAATLTSLTRSGSTATGSLALTDANKFGTAAGNTAVVAITQLSGSDPNESAYLGGNLTITCTNTGCTQFTYGPVTLTPTTPATGSAMTAYSASTPPDRDTLIKWVRGQDNYGDELGPGGTVTVRPSIHGDVLHSRPLVVNYGGSTTDKIVVYYGSNDGVFHAVNGNQTRAIEGVPAGDELWGLVLPEHFGYLNRQRIASPELKFPTTSLATATTKDYFVDGPTGAYQKLNSDGTINKAYIYLTMRRGGRFLYALDVSPDASGSVTKPKFLWKIDTSAPGFAELGQTWSRPRLTLLQSTNYKTIPVLVFGGGYDTAEDSEPPGTDTMGRGIFIVNALDGSLIWSVTASSGTCPTGATCVQQSSMTYAISSDVTFVDRDGDGYTDKIYVGDLGGNVWRVDVADASRSNWKVTKIAALGCDTGTCPSGTTPRKFFFPPAVLSVKAAGATGSFDAVSIVSGDREHPLKSSDTNSAYFTRDGFFMVMDQTTTVNPATYLTANVTRNTLFSTQGGTVQWNWSSNGFYMTFYDYNGNTVGEKGVNAPLAVNGSIFFSTNQPAPPSATCAANLGTARAYAISPFTGQVASNVLSGGGLPPSPVAGLVSINTTNADGTPGSVEERFCIGCGLATPPGTPGQTACTGNAALQNCTPATTIPSNLKRTYWYKR